jgi:hypothetical protein
MLTSVSQFNAENGQQAVKEPAVFNTEVSRLLSRPALMKSVCFFLIEKN